jgi:hypothetical protein
MSVEEVLAMIKEKYRKHNEIGLESLEESQITNYKCSQCGCSGKKLWREMNIINRIELRCVSCIPDVKPEVLERVKEGASECGWWVAAVPCGGGGYWGYSHVPEKLANWWYSMPL